MDRRPKRLKLDSLNRYIPWVYPIYPGSSGWGQVAGLVNSDLPVYGLLQVIGQTQTMNTMQNLA